MPLWFVRGKAFFKQEVCRRVDLDVSTLPYHPQLITCLSEANRQDRPVFLVTGADHSIAQRVADHVGGFSSVIASDGVTNLTSGRKRDELVRRFGTLGFDYAGNSRHDLLVWSESRKGIVVNARAAILARAREVCHVAAVLDDRPHVLRSLVRAARAHQWVKNLLIFVPLITSHRLTDLTLVLSAFLACVAFSLCASSVYVLNDLVDLQADRKHHKKRHRPFAAGNLPLSAGVVLEVFLLATAFSICWFLPPKFGLTLAAYCLASLAYSLYLKRKLLVDVFLLGGLYTIRVLAGNAATGIAYSSWLAAFSMFLFVSLAFVKRYTELSRSGQKELESLPGRGYLTLDKSIVANLGTSSGFLCVLVLALYINSPQVEPLYGTPILLWLLCPLLMYWISRLWIITCRQKMDSDPVVFALKDKLSYLVAACAGVVLVLATFKWSL